MRKVLILVGVLAAAALTIYIEVATWKECRESHSWLYCARTLNSR